MNAITYAEDLALSAHLARVDRFADLGELSYTDLLSLEDDLSESSDWSLLDDVKAAIAERESDAHDALAKLFVEQCMTCGEVPMPEAGKITPWTADTYISVSLDAGWASMASDALTGRITRERLFEAMAQEYVEQQAIDLLKAGWSAQ